jgi:hypothetical protein
MDEILIDIKDRELSNDEESFFINNVNISNTLDEINKPVKKSKNLYICEAEGCNKFYRSKENLTLHFKNKHLNLKPYKCRFCNSFFSHRNGNF